MTTSNVAPHTFERYASNQHLQNLDGQIAAQLMFMYEKAVAFEAPVILELGTATGASTAMFTAACEKRSGRCVSVDIADCATASDSSLWQFVQQDSANIQGVLAKAPHLKAGIDVLYIDSLHTREHVTKELTGWWPYMKRDSWIIFDDVDANPYRRGQRKDNFWHEVQWSGIHDYVLEFFHSNEDSCRLSIIYGSTGLACLKKLSDMGTKPNAAAPIRHRRNTAFDVLRFRPRSFVRRLFS
jgi:predicted O-methyltransferase YrrM